MPEMCPNYHFWAGIPSLIKVEYATAQCHVACYRIKPKKSKSRSPSHSTLFIIKGKGRDSHTKRIGVLAVPFWG